MNIWMVNYAALKPTSAGGTRHYTLAHTLTQQGHDVTIIGAGLDYMRSGSALPADQFQRCEVFNGVRFLWLRTAEHRDNMLSRARHWLSFAFKVWRGVGIAQLPRPDIIIGSSPSLFAAFAAERLARRLHVPFVLEVRDLWPAVIVEIKGISPRHPGVLVMAWIERYLYRHSVRIIALQAHAQAHMTSKGAHAENILWIPNGVDVDMLPEPQPLAESDSLVAMYAGSHNFANNTELLLDVAAKLKADGWGNRVQLRFVGDGPRKLPMMARAQAENLTNTRFDDPVPKTEIYRVMAQADIFLSPVPDAPQYRWGLAANKMFDYMAAARPIISTINTEDNPIQQINAGMIVPADDPQVIVDAIKALAQKSADVRWQMGKNGRAYVEDHYNLRQHALRLEIALKEIANKS